MEKSIQLKKEFSTIENVLNFVKNYSDYNCSEEYDSWDVRTDANGQMEKCGVIKKSNMHGMKFYFSGANELKMSYIIPNKVMNAYFGKSMKARKNILEIVAGGIKNTMLAGSQKKAFNEMELIIKKMEA